MNVTDQYYNGVIEALEKVAGDMTLDQAREYIKTKKSEKGQDAFYTGTSGIGAGIAEGLGDYTPMSGKAIMIPAALGGLAVSKAKHLFDSPHMYKRDGDLTGRAIGGIGGGALGAGAGALAGNLLDDSGWGMGLGSLLGGVLGSSAGQSVGDFATEQNNKDVIRQAKNEDRDRQKAISNKFYSQKA